MARDRRRLAAIVCADVAGYSRLMGVDEAGTLAMLKSHLRDLFEPKIAEYGGRIVKTTGDGLLVEFASVVDAVRCAVDVQRGMGECNAGVASDKRIDFRIGINVGDIIIDGGDIYGDGVNVAARLQALAEPGEICVSKVVRDQVLDKLDFSFEDLGAQRVKNIARPVEAYRVELARDLRARSHRRRSRFAHVRSSQWIAPVVVVLTVLGGGLWALPRFIITAPAPEPPAFSLAVVPFSVSPDSPSDRQFADDVVHGIGSALRRTTPYVKVVFSLGPAADADRHADARSVAHERNVRYVLEGDIGVDGDTAKVAMRLLDAQAATQIWIGEVAAPRMKWTRASGDATFAFVRDLRDAIVGGGRKLHRYGGRKMHTPTGYRLWEGSGSRGCTGGSKGCCYATIWSVV